MESLLLSFDNVVGWRVRGRTLYKPSILVITSQSGKLLQVPSTVSINAGKFCNPRTIVLEHFYSVRLAGRSP